MYAFIAGDQEGARRLIFDMASGMLKELAS